MLLRELRAFQIRRVREARAERVRERELAAAEGGD